MGSDGFVVFEAEKRPRKLKPDEVSLTKSNIVMSEALHAELGASKRVLLLFNEHTRTIGIRPTGDEASGYRLSYRSLSARSFYLHFGIYERGRFRGKVEKGVLTISLPAT